MSSSFKTHNKKLQPGHVLLGENGQVVDTIATISASHVLIVGVDVITYVSLQAIVTMPVGVDLTPLETAKPVYTGRYVLVTEDGAFYYIDRTTVDVSARTFVISRVEGSQINPTSIDLSAGWKIAEAEIVNRLATTAAAKVDSIEFRDLNFQVELDGDPVTVRGLNGNYLEPNPDGSTNVVLGGKVDDGNSSSNLLFADEEFLGTPIDTLDYALIFITVFSDVASAVDGCHVKVSSDGITWRDSDSYTIPANTEKTFSFQPVKRYFRIHYVNGGADQGVMDLQVILKRVNSKPSSHRISDVITSEDDATLQTSVIKVPTNDDITFENISIQHPIPITDGLMYAQDLNLVESDQGNFVGTLNDLFDNSFNNLVDNTANNPKIIDIKLHRPFISHRFGIQTKVGDGDFSNVKVYSYIQGVGYTLQYDGSADSTKKTFLSIELPTTTLSGVRLEFHTTDTITIGQFNAIKAGDTNAHLRATKPDRTVTEIGATDSGNLKVSDAENGLAIAKGEVIGTSAIAKFGENPDISSATTPEDIWDYGGIYTFSTTNDIDSISSSDAGDTHEITVVGLDVNWEEVIQTVILTGQTRKALDTPLIRVYRAYNSSGTVTLGDVYVYVNGPITLGVPDTAVDVRAMIRISHEQTMMLVYTVPAGKTAYWMGGYVSLSTTKAALAIFAFKIREFGGVFRDQSAVSTSSTGSNSFIINKFVPGVMPEKTDILVRCVEVSVNGVGVSSGMDFILVDNVL